MMQTYTPRNGGEGLSAEMFSNVVELFTEEDSEKSGDISWLFHDHDKSLHSASLSAMVNLVLGNQIYAQVLRKGFAPRGDFISLQVPWRVRQEVKKEVSPSDYFVETSAERLARLAGTTLYGMSIRYIFPDPASFQRDTLGQPDVHVLLSTSEFQAGGSHAIVSVRPGDLASEVSLVSRAVLTSKGVDWSACYGKPSGPLQHAVNDYIQNHIAPGLRSLEQRLNR